MQIPRSLPVWIALLSLSAWAATSTAADAEDRAGKHLFLLSGQSNMD